MIFIAAKFKVLPSTRTSGLRGRRVHPVDTQRAGCLWFDWTRSVENTAEYILVEAFRDDEAGVAHVESEHFKNAQRTLHAHLVETPRVVNTTVPQDGWSELGETAVPEQG